MKKPIPNFENYSIYDTGEVVNEQTGKMLSGTIRLNGYKVYRLSKDNVKTGFYAHRLVAENFLDNPNNLPIINHKDGNKLNNEVNNLEWCSYSENSSHAYENGLISKRRETEYYTEDLDDEQWVSIDGFPSYLLSSHGRVRNIQTNRILKSSTVCGYQKVRLSNNGIVQDFTVHLLVFKTFYPDINIPDGYVIDHIDGNKSNNNYQNLRCVSLRENSLSAFYDTKTNKSIKVINQYDLNGNFIATYPSIREAARILSLDSSSITKACKGKVKTCGGFKFSYASND